MTRQRDRRTRLAALLLLVAAGGGWLGAQTLPDVGELRAALEDRYDLVPLQQGVALVPRDPDAGVGMIQVVGGAVSVDGAPLTGGELSAILGADAALVVQVSYLDVAGQRQLADAPPAPAVVAPPAVPPAPPLPPAAPRVPRQARAGDRVRVGGGVTVDRDERVTGDAVAIFGPARIDGEVGGDAVTILSSTRIDGEVFGDVVTVMGSLDLGPNAIIHGEATVVGGTITRAPGAQLLGGINEVSPFGAGSIDAPVGFPFDRGFGPFGVMNAFWERAGNFAASVVRAILLILVGLIAVAVARPSLERVAEQGRTDAVRSGLIGLLAEVLFVPVLIVTIIVLAVSVVGIPLIFLVPFGVLFVVALMLLGFSGVAYAVGQTILDRLGWSERGAYVAVTFGVVAILAFTLLARLAGLGAGFLGWPLGALGYLVEYVAWTVGFGAGIVALIEWRRRRGAPMTPPEPPPPPLPGEA